MNHEISSVNLLIPDFTISATNQLESKLSNFSGKNLVFFFYPKDNTPVCASEAKAFRDHFEAFNQLDTIIFGVSRDNLASHERFKTRLELPFELISDQSEELCNYFDVIKMKTFFGKKVRGIVRSTFVIDKNRILRHAWRKVKVSGHIEEVITAVNQL